MSIEIEGLDRLISLVNELEKVPQKVATKSARAGANIELKAARQDAPVHDGWLKASLKIIGERSKKGQSKKVYEVTFDRAYNSKLVKISKSGKRSYYPVSQEYGWKYKNGGGHYGLQYMKNTAHDRRNEMEEKMIKVAADDIQKILDKAR